MENERCIDSLDVRLPYFQNDVIPCGVGLAQLRKPVLNASIFSATAADD